MAKVEAEDLVEINGVWVPVTAPRDPPSPPASSRATGAVRLRVSRRRQAAPAVAAMANASSCSICKAKANVRLVLGEVLAVDLCTKCKARMDAGVSFLKTL
jgi:ribosomal protein L37AE/L43A